MTSTQTAVAADRAGGVAPASVAWTCAPGWIFCSPSTTTLSPATRPSSTSHLSVDGPADPNRSLLDLVVSAYDHGRGVALRITCHALLRNEQGVLAHAAADEGPHVHAGQDQPVWIRRYDAQRVTASGRIDRDVGEGELAVVLVASAVLEQQRDRQITRALQLAGSERLAQFEQFGGRLREVDVDRVECPARLRAARPGSRSPTRPA